MGQKESKADLVNLSSEFVEQVAQSFGNRPNQMHETLRDWPLCICARRGSYRELLALLKLGADANKRSLLDGRSCVQLAVNAESAICCFQLYEYGAKVTMEDGLQAAILQNADLMRVILSRQPGYQVKQVIASVLFGGEEREETV